MQNDKYSGQQSVISGQRMSRTKVRLVQTLYSRIVYKHLIL